jgi:hypothetical protein
MNDFIMFEVSPGRFVKLAPAKARKVLEKKRQREMMSSTISREIAREFPSLSSSRHITSRVTTSSYMSKGSDLDRLETRQAIREHLISSRKDQINEAWAKISSL